MSVSSGLPRTAKLTASRRKGSMLGTPCINSTRGSLRKAPGSIGQCVQQQGEEDEQDAQAQRQRQVPTGGLQRDSRGHRPGVSGDVATDDQHRAHLSTRAAETGQNGGDQAEARVTEQGGDGTSGAGAKRAQL